MPKFIVHKSTIRKQIEEIKKFASYINEILNEKYKILNKASKIKLNFHKRIVQSRVLSPSLTALCTSIESRFWLVRSSHLSYPPVSFLISTIGTNYPSLW